MTAVGEPPRWRYRYRNFTDAFTLFREAAGREPELLNDLEREGLIRRFRYTFESAWKTLRDRLEHDGVQLATVTPRNVMREAFAAGMIDDGLLGKLTQVFATYPDLESVTLFGSRAAGSATPRSDIDLATRGIRDRRTLGRLALDLEDLDVPQKIDAKALENISYTPLVRHSEAVGVVIYQRPTP